MFPRTSEVKYSIYFVTNGTSFHFQKVVIWCEEESNESAQDGTTTRWRPTTNISYNIAQMRVKHKLSR